MSETQPRNYMKSFKAQMATLDEKIEILDKAMTNKKLTTNDFLKKLREYQFLSTQRELLKRKMANLKQGRNPWGEPMGLGTQKIHSLSINI